MHPNIPSSDVTFFVTREPRYGTLELDQGQADVRDDVKVKVEAFEQSIINDNKLRYVQVSIMKSNCIFVC